MSSLVLLIGTNPLPNYVVAEYLISKNQIDEIWLVHSEKTNEQTGTGETAKQLKEVLSNRHSNISFKYCSLSDVGDAKKLVREIENMLEEVNKEGSLHFNYTGGTKVMSVHTYRTIEKCDKFINKSFSYLDARKFRLKDDERGIVSNDLREEVTISLKDLIKIHGYERYKEEKNYYWPDVLKIFKDFINQKVLSKFLKWKNEVIRKLFYENEKFIESRKRLQDKLIEKKNLFFDAHSFKDMVLPLLQVFPKEHAILDDTGQSLWIPDGNTSNNEYKHRVQPAIEFLDGKWLENYVFMILNDKIKEEFPNKGIEVKSNWKLKKEGDGKDFELDVIVINGYQVCGISCTTSKNEGKCKEKGFEVLHRVDQIGGEEARAVLVTCLTHTQDGDQVERLKDDLRYDTGSAEDKLLVLGIEDLQEDKIWKKIKLHIWGR